MVAMAATTLLTSDQFLAMPEATQPPPPTQHDIIRSNLLEILFAYLSANRSLGLKVLPLTAFVASPGSVFVPDISVVALARLDPRDTYIQGTPDLAIEVISPTDLEIHLRQKIDLYLSHGSKSVWVVYPDARSVVIYHADSIARVKADQSITDPFLPGFSTPVAAFFELT
jgi:Uma2 family endonuclease